MTIKKMNNINLKLNQFDVKRVLPLHWGNYEISLTNLSLTVFFTLVLGVYILYIFFNEQIIPRNWQIVFESLFLFVYKVSKQQHGNGCKTYLHLIFSLFTFILFLNVVGYQLVGYKQELSFYYYIKEW